MLAASTATTTPEFDWPTWRPDASTPPAHGAQAETARLITFVEPEESFLSQSIRGFALSLVTLGLYSFWARADSRRQLHRAIRIDGSPLDYTGTGGESLVSFVIGTVTTVVLVSTFLHFAGQNGPGGTGEAISAVMSDFRWRRLLISTPLLFFLGSIAYRRRKHVLRRTWWRGHHFDLDDRPWGYALQHFWTAFLVPLTLGWAAPWRAHYLERRKIREMHHGDRRFETRADVARLYRAFAVLWFGGGILYVATMVLLGLTIGEPLLKAATAHDIAPLLVPGVMKTGLVVLATGITPVIGFLLFYRAAWIEHQLSSLTFDGVQLRLRLPKRRFVALELWSVFVKIISFGSLQPVVHAAMVRFIIQHIEAVPVHVTATPAAPAPSPSVLNPGAPIPAPATGAAARRQPNLLPTLAHTPATA